MASTADPGDVQEQPQQQENPPVDSEFPGIPDLEDFDYITPTLLCKNLVPKIKIVEVAALTIEDPSSYPAAEAFDWFDIRIATLEKQAGEWRVAYHASQAQRYREQLTDTVDLEMVAIPSGEFAMGSPNETVGYRYNNESPQHRVKISSFYMGRYPVTQAQWRVVAAMPQENRRLKSAPSRFTGDARPVERVSWNDAVEFCARLSRQTGRAYRLPSEAEWEYACRAGTNTPFHFGEMITTEVANYDGSAYRDGPKGKKRGETTPVTEFGIANAFGLSDMHGNIWEWCLDHWHNNYYGAPTDGSAWLSTIRGEGRIRRGGFWGYDPWTCRSASRYHCTSDAVDYSIGFRVVLALRGTP